MLATGLNGAATRTAAAAVEAAVSVDDRPALRDPVRPVVTADARRTDAAPRSLAPTRDDEPVESAGAAEASAQVPNPIATPIPSATARPPTRPIIAAFVIVSGPLSA